MMGSGLHVASMEEELISLPMVTSIMENIKREGLMVKVCINGEVVVVMRVPFKMA
jgi:hypothetical protein